MMGVLINWTVGSLLQCASNHHDIHFKYRTVFLVVSYILKKLNKKNASLSGEPLAQQVWFSDALYKGFLIRNDIEWVLWKIILHKNTSLFFWFLWFWEWRAGSGLSHLRDLVTLFNSPGLCGSPFSLVYSGNYSNPRLTHWVVVKIRVGVNEHLKSNQKPSILPRSNVIAHEVNTSYGCCFIIY